MDWNRLRRRSVIGAMIVIAGIQLALAAGGTQYGLDFRGGTWQAGHALLHGLSPYPARNAANLLHTATAFITPPLLAVVGAPFSMLPFAPAVLLWNLICVVALVAALRIVGVRDPRLYALAFCSFPFVSSLALGQPDGLFALLAAAAWRYRDSPWGALAGGALIAAKLLAWPFVIWLLVTRRFRMAAITGVSAVGWLALSWASIGFKGLTAYPRLLAADTRAYGPKSHSFVAAITRLGLSLPAAEVLTAVLVLAAASAIVVLSRGADEGWFTAALFVGVFLSPVVWQHYLVLLFVPLAIMRRLRDPLIWVLVAALWLSPGETPAALWQAWLVPLIAVAVLIRAAAAGRSRRTAPLAVEPAGAC